MSLSPAQFALVAAPFTLLAGWSILQAWRTGKITSRGWTFQANDSPLGFWLTDICHFGIFAFGLALALHALGLIGDPIVPLRIELPHFV
jgi:hypothetical protein